MQTPRLMLWLAIMLAVVAAPGCRGCIRTENERLSSEELKKRAQEQKEAIVATQLQSLPADSEIKTVVAKPGHWVETSRRIRSNREDLQVIATGDVTRGTETVLKIPETDLTTEFARPTVLPKGQWKTIDLQYFVPTTTIAIDPNKPTPTGLRLRSNLVSRALLTPILQEPFPANELRFAEYMLAIVSPRPQEYSFLNASDIAMWRGNDLMQEEIPRSYYIVQCGSQDGKLAFPTSLLSMTMLAVVVWDDLAPDDLSEDQKTALIDWLHWGGQLIISGPGSWSRLQNSFLTPYLPVASAEPAELGTDELSALNYWVVNDLSGGGRDGLTIVGSPIPGLNLTLASGCQWLPETNRLVAERAVGRGRVVMTGFPIREQRLYRWKYFSSFFSTGLLRRPGRKIKKNFRDQTMMQVWDDPFEGQENNPLLNTHLRFVSRDVPLTSKSEGARAFAERSENELARRLSSRNAIDSLSTDEPRNRPMRQVSTSNEAVQWSVNGAAWSDTSGFAFRALSALRSAAGIVLPDRWTILMLIGGYLAILVPINWVVFRLMGRLEYAWIAAPIIAIAGVLVVTRVARLDIGFARRTTEIGLLELHGDYPRGHLTNYTALYTSLSTNYTLDYPEPGSVALPLGDVGTRPRSSGLSSSRTISIKYGSNPGIRMEPVTVYSNSTELLHAEQMVGLPGGLMYGTKDDAPAEAAIKNKTGLQLYGCLLLRVDAGGVFQIAWVGDLTDDKTHDVKFETAKPSDVWKYWSRSPITNEPAINEDGNEKKDQASDSPAKEPGTVEPNQLVVGGILSELVRSLPIVAGQTRMLAYTDQRPGKMESPQADGQLDTRTVVVAHLTSPLPKLVSRDKEIIGRTASVELPPDPTQNIPIPNE